MFASAWLLAPALGLALAVSGCQRPNPDYTGPPPDAIGPGPPSPPTDGPTARQDGPPPLPAPDAAPGDPPPAACAPVPALGAAPTLDGTLEPGLQPRRLTAGHWHPWTPGALAPARTDYADYAIAWRPDGLYFHLRVVDPSVHSTVAEFLYCEDSVEIYVDHDGAYPAAPQYDAAGTRQFIVAAPRTGATEAKAESYASSKRLGPLTSTGWRSVRIAGGYAVEGFVSAAALGVSRLALTPGARLGYAVALNVANRAQDATTSDCRAREGAYVLRSGTAGCGFPHCNPATFCTSTLAR